MNNIDQSEHSDHLNQMASEPLSEVSDSEAPPRTDLGASGESRVVPLDRHPASSPPARKSTGPRTSAGKDRSRRNAIKHGILAKVVLLEDESRSEFSSMLSGLRNDLQPEGAFEEVLVERLATLLWRHRRLLIAETAEIERKTLLVAVQEDERHEKEANEVFDRSQVDHRGLLLRRNNPIVLERCLALLDELKERVAENGFDLVSDREILRKLYGGSTGELATDSPVNAYSVWYQTAECSEQERRRQNYATAAECKEGFVKILETEIRHLNRYKRAKASIESEKLRLESLRLKVPDAPWLDRLLRYEANLDRAFDRTLTQLERLQRIRLGQPVSAPIKVSISS